MSKEQSRETKIPADFNIKHRLVGAAVLIIFGVLVLPWMLGPPNTNIGGEDAHAARQSELEVGFGDQEVDFDSGFEGQEAQETVYVSKITPLDGDSGSTSSSANKDKAPKVKEPKANEPKAQVVKDKPVPEPKEKVKDKKPESIAKEVEAGVKPTETTKEAAPAVAQPKQEPPVAAVVPSVDIGWVVQVGLFSTTGYEARAKKLVSDLLDDGFKADSTLVETNRGKGMRVWLGPFAKRADASREVERLKGLTGKDGFVRVYP